MKASSPYCVKLWCWKTWSPQSTGCSRKKSTIKCVCYLQVLLGASMKTVCHKQVREGRLPSPACDIQFSSTPLAICKWSSKMLSCRFLSLIRSLIYWLTFQTKFIQCSYFSLSRSSTSLMSLLNCTKSLNKLRKKMFWISSPVVHLIKTSQFPVLTTKACKLPPPPPGEKHGTACWCFLDSLPQWCLQSEFLPSWAIFGNQQITDCPEHWSSSGSTCKLPKAFDFLPN